MDHKVDILVVEDDEDICELVEFNLKRSGFSVDSAVNGVDGLAKIHDLRPKLIVLDIMMPEMDGISLLRKLREGIAFEKSVPVILLSAKGEETDVVVGLELGADDYVSKPFSPKELISRVRAVLRRADAKSNGPAEESSRKHQVIGVGDVVMDITKHEATYKGQQLSLTLAEFNLLYTLISEPGRVFTRDQLLEKVSGKDTFVIDRNVDVHIRSIRKKMSDDLEYIQTVRGVGYKCRDV
jgi:DNA-binding response OmpR family regulator